MVREWLIFAICLGLGGHLALGVILHAPEFWSLRDAGLNGFLAGLGLYLGVQLFRWVWGAARGFPKAKPMGQRPPL